MRRLVRSASRPTLVTTLGERLATIGRLQWLGPLDRFDAGGPPAPRTNSAQRVRVLHDRFRVSSAQVDALREMDAPVVLLVDDRVDSGWTMAIAGRELRRAGAAQVLPFALALDA